MAKKKKKPAPSPPSRRKKASSRSKKPAPARRSTKEHKREYTKEQDRGGTVMRTMAALMTIRRHHEGKPFNKEMLADWLQRDFDHSLDGLLIQKESRWRNAERIVTTLTHLGVDIVRTDSSGKELPESSTIPDLAPRAKGATEAHPTPKVWWKYNADECPVYKELKDLFTDFRITPYQVEGIMACQALLKNFYGLKMEAGVRSAFERLMAAVPESVKREARQQSYVWQYQFRRPGKYATRQKLLRTWNDATILQKQCTLAYLSLSTGDVSGEVVRTWCESETPPSGLKVRRVAAFGTVFHPEEDSIYLVGCEQAPAGPTEWKRPIQYKFDRVVSLTMEDDPNPSILSMPMHDRVALLGKKEPSLEDRIDLQRLFADSAGAFFNYGDTIRLEVRIHDPALIALCYEKPFHRNQVIEFGPGTHEVTLTIDRCFQQEVLPRLLAMKTGFTVAGPEGLAQEIREVAMGIADRHPPPATKPRGKKR